ncbi:MAG TPA: PD-(D/E)XK nuclease family protein [Anaeromyxobacteraceae bacterium]|nr:PD-(D/E)XK nuclease family protein [Anaeromyxobacteraceae bacterium]
MRVLLLDTPTSLAAAVAALPAAGPLPARTVLVPSERHAHALRRAMVRSGHRAALAGTRLVGSFTAALEALRAAGVPFSPGEDRLRPARLLALFGEDLRLQHFDLPLLREARGWNDAFAAAIADLEAAGLSPADLPDPPQPRDLALLWKRVAAESGTSFSRARVYLEAAARLARDRRAWPFDGPVLALATGHEDVAEARFLAAIPGVTLGLRCARPQPARFLDRVAVLFGTEARAALERGAEERVPRAEGGAAPERAPHEPKSERDRLASFLFDPLAGPGRAPGPGPDGTVDLEEHAGVEAELEASATWVARQVLEKRRPLEEIAVLTPVRDPLVQLVADRLSRLRLDGAPLPVHVAGGLPAVAEAAGARVLAVLNALALHLRADALAAVIPALRLDGVERNHLSHGDAMELAYGLGTVGGNAANPKGALEWSRRAEERLAELETALAHARKDEDSAAREEWRLERTLKNLRAVRPALDALVGVARAVVEGASLAAIREALAAFFEKWLLAPGDGARIWRALVDSLAPACGGPLGKALAGEAALEVVQEHLLSLRVPRGRFGEPAVYVGTVQGAVGLDFEAVRVVGLSEGALPSRPVEDPVLPERAREALEKAAPGRVLPRVEDRVAAQLQGLVAAVRSAREAVALSAPRVDLARTEREPASLFVDAAIALARTAAAGARQEAVPGTAALGRDYFRPAHDGRAAFRRDRPVSESAWLDRAARFAPEPPPGWGQDQVVSLGRLGEIWPPRGRLGPADGILLPGDPFPQVPGLDPQRPISASGLRDLLQCPRMFLMRRILHWEEPAGAPSLRELDAASYGSLLHRVVEVFFREHGRDFVARKGALPEWQALARAIADREFDAFLSEYPLVGEGVRRKERERLHESLEAFLRYDWELSRGRKRRFVGVELPFGEEQPLSTTAGGVTLHLRGYIDRVDVEGDAAVVRDLKSGKAYPRRGDEAGPTAVRDVQLGVYQLAAVKLAPVWKTPRKVEAAYAYASGREPVQERAFRDDREALEKATGEWLATAARLLSERRFPSTADEGDCEYCPFQPLCGAAAPRRAQVGLAEEDEESPLGRFLAMKVEDEG